MGVMSTMKFLGGRGSNLMLAAKLVPEVSRLVKKRSKDQVATALESDEGMTAFAKELYKELNPQLRTQVPEEGFVAVVLQNRQRLMGKKKNKKKVEAAK